MQEKNKKILSIIMPFYNEPTLLEILKKVMTLENHTSFNLEIILVDDGSTFKKDEICEEYIKYLKNVKYLKHSINKGKGAALKTAIKHCIGDIIIIQDADLEYNPIDIPKVIAPILEKKTLVSFGSRHLEKSQKISNKNWLKKHLKNVLIPYLGGRLITKTCNILFGTKLTDLLTCYKAIDAKLLKSISLVNNGFELETEIAAKLLKTTQIVEVPISYFPRTKAEGKKIKLKDGFKLLFTLIRYRFKK